MSTAWHLARRFVETLGPAEPRPDEEAFAATILSPGEAALWRRMSAADRRHALAVAGRVRAGGEPYGTRREVLAAALLHDVGKVEAEVGVWARVAATVTSLVLGRRRVAGWSGRPGLLGRMGRYVSHPGIGATLLSGAGSDPLTVAWAAQHHLDPARWDVPQEVGALLKAADDD
jgi:HD domain